MARNTNMDDSNDLTLYIFPSSLYSTMARLTFAFGKTYRRGSHSKALPEVELKLVNLHRDETLTQEFLELNPKGQVPILTAKDHEVLTGSLDISYLFCRKFFPDMLPETHEDKIRELLSKLHAIQGRSLSVSKERMREEWTDELLDPKLEELLAMDGLPDEYLRALRFKKQL